MSDDIGKKISEVLSNPEMMQKLNEVMSSLNLTNEKTDAYDDDSNYIATNANPMAVLQAYQLTENKELLERRAIPTVANLLTRPNLHINWTLNESLYNWGGHEIGSPIKYYNLNVMGGVYEQMGGTLPWLLNYAI